MRLRYLVAVVVLALGVPALAADCAEWNTSKFFELATAWEVRKCLEAGANVDARLRGGVTPLHEAARKNANPAVVELLLDAGAWVNARDDEGKTPLHLVARSLLRKRGGEWVEATSPAVIWALIEAGADMSARDDEGKTPWDYARVNEDLEGTVALLLLQEGARE